MANSKTSNKFLQLKLNNRQVEMLPNSRFLLKMLLLAKMLLPAKTLNSRLLISKLKTKQMPVSQLELALNEYFH